MGEKKQDAPAHPEGKPLLNPLRSDLDRRTLLLFAGLMLALFLSALDQTVFATALPTIVGELDGVDHMLWVTTAYLLSATLVMPVYGKFGDLLGRKVLLLAALVLFLLGSVLGALASGMGGLILGRAVQGLGGGGLLILTQAIVADVIPERERARYMGVVGAVFALSSLVGPLLGGWFAEGIGWRWALWINLPLGGLAIASAVVFLDLPRQRVSDLRVDVRGIAALAVGVTSVVLLTSWGGTTRAWTSPLILFLGVVTLLSAVVFVLVERRAVEPVMPLTLFRDRNFNLATGAGLVMAVAMFGTIGYLPTYLQMVNGLSPTLAGLTMLSLIAGLALATVGSGRIVSRTGRYKWLPVIGSLLVAAALGLMSTLQPSTSLLLTGSYLFVFGAGAGCALQILVLIAQNSVDASEVGTATAANSFFREIGVSFGSAVVGTLFTSRLTALLSERLAGAGSAGLDPNGLTPAGLAGLPDEVRGAIASSYNDALTPVFLYVAPLMLVGGIALAWVRAKPLATTVEEHGPQPQDDQQRGERRPVEGELARRG
jgi:EmrB/QacA subfamily drug resistance transporter